MNNSYSISLRSTQNENNDENTISNESISENKRSKIVKISTLYKELDYILNKFSGQNNENEENESPSKKNSFSNNILVSSDQEKISLNKEQFLNYERQIKRLDLISVLSYENFSQFFNFLPPRTSEIKSFYGIDFKDQTLKNSDLSIFSQIHESNTKSNSFLFEVEQFKFQKKKNLSFGEEPMNIYNKILMNQNMSQIRKEKEIQNLTNCRDQCFEFVCKQQNIIKTPKAIIKKKEENIKIYEKTKKSQKKMKKDYFNVKYVH